MSEFTERIKFNTEKEYNETNSNIDAYKEFVSTSIPGFIILMETFNQVLNSIEDNYIMSNVQFKARIKDVIGAINSSENKPLDDIFGFEFITPHETEKELLMLLTNYILEDEICSREKIHNKSNGYKAYHRVGIIKKENNRSTSFDDIKKYVLSKKAKRLKKEHRDKTRKELHSIPEDEIYDEVFLYPELKKLINKNNLSQSTIDALVEGIDIIYSSLSQINPDKIPAIEVQFKTSQVAEEAMFGTASHTHYKNVAQQDIIDKYTNRKLIRGINFPFKFQREGRNMHLQLADKTLFEMYPFLKDTIRKEREGKSISKPNYNWHFSEVFPALREYIEELAKHEPYNKINNIDQKNIWQIIKQKIISLSYSESENSKKQDSKEGGR